MSLVGGDPGQRWPCYMANERQWVRRILCRMTAEERVLYEMACGHYPRHYRTGRLYDRAKAEIAETVMLESRR